MTAVRPQARNPIMATALTRFASREGPGEGAFHMHSSRPFACRAQRVFNGDPK
jgi:hypothetical protein